MDKRDLNLRKIKVLFLASNPIDTKSLRLDLEIREISEKIRASSGREFIDLISIWAVRPDDLMQAFNEHHPDIVHFSGHGTNSEGIILEDKNGKSKLVEKKAIKKLFQVFSGNIRLVVFNACFSYEQAHCLTEFIDCTIGTYKAVGDQAAITFAASFYRAIGFGHSVQEAFDQGKAALAIDGITDDSFSLLTRNGINTSNLVLVNNPSDASRPLDILRDQVSIDRFYRRNGI
jgi:hypothetical protein